MTAPTSDGGLRVAFLIKSLPVTPWVADQAAVLAASGVEVHPLVSRIGGGDAPGGVALAGTAPVRVLGGGSLAGRLAGLAADGLRLVATRPGAAAAAARRWRRRDGLLRARAAVAALAARADLLHVHFGNTAVMLLPVRRLTGLPLVVSFYGWDASAAPLKNPRLYEDLFREAAAIVVLSEEMRATLRRLGCPARKLHVVHIAVRVGELRAALERAGGRREVVRDGDAELRLLAVGRLVEKKGLDDALEALAVLARRGVRYQFRIVGEGPLRGELESLTRRLGLNGQVEFAGALPREEVFREMAVCDAFFLPSRQAASGDREGTPTVLIEAGALGIPCVATRHAGTPEVVLDGVTGLLAAERDAAGLAAHLERLARDPTLRASLGEAARRHIEAEFEMEGQIRLLKDISRAALEAGE